MKWNSILQGNCLEVLPTLDAGSIDSLVTSPPYYGLRDYGIPPSDWPEVQFAPMPGLPMMTIPAQQVVHGLEKDIWSYVAHEVAIFREVRRVLAEHGTLFLNLGDSYVGGGPHHGDKNTGKSGTNRGSASGTDRVDSNVNRYGLRQDLTPEQVAYVLSELAKARVTSEATQEGRE